MRTVRNTKSCGSRKALATLAVLAFFLFPALGALVLDSQPAGAEPPLPELSLQRDEILNSVFIPLERPASENGSSWERDFEQDRNSVLAEIFTASWCGPCVRADEALEELLDEDEYYSRLRFNSIFYHPRPDDEDPFGTNEGASRMRDLYGFDSFPSVRFDGVKEQIGSPGNVFDIYLDHIRDQLSRTETLGYQGNVSVNGEDVSLEIEVLPRSQYGPINLRLLVMVVEDHLYFEGSNGISDHRYVLRDIVSEDDFVISDTAVPFTKNIQMDGDWNMSNSSLVVLAQSTDYQFFGGEAAEPEDDEGSELSTLYLVLPVVALAVIIGAVALRARFMDRSFQEKMEREKEQLRQAKNHKCESCEESFASREELKSHEKNAHYTVCPACGAKLKESNLESHMRKAHGG